MAALAPGVAVGKKGTAVKGRPPPSKITMDPETGLPQLPIRKKLGEPVVITRKLSKTYVIPGGDQVMALKSINLDKNSEFYPVRKGEFVMVRGASGGGKTTLLNLIGSIDSLSSGSLEILGSEITTASKESYLARLRLEKIGFVFQTFNLLATLSAFENVELPMTLLGKLKPKERRRRAAELLTLVGLQDRMNHLPSELSGGEQQRVTIARSLANSPELLLLDEPTGDLDTLNTVEVMDLLLDINQTQQTTMICVTHNPDIEVYCDRMLYIADGKIDRQVINYEQSRLVYEDYIEYLNQDQ